MKRLMMAALALAFGVAGTSACATKGYVKNQVGQVSTKVDSLSQALEATQERTRQNEAKISEVDQRAIDKGDGRLPRLLRVDEMAERRLRRDDLRTRRLDPGVAAGVITVMVSVDDVADRLIRHRFEHRQDIGGVLLELVVDQHHAFARDERCRVARHERIVDDEQIVLDLDQIQSRRLIPELLAVHIRHDQQQQDSGSRRDACCHANDLRTAL